MKGNYLAIISLISILSFGCTYNPMAPIQETKTIPANSELSRFFIFGDTFASGYMDGALYRDGQRNSFGSIVAQKLDEAFLQQDFKQNIVDSDNGLNGEIIDEGEVDGKFEIYFPTPTFIYPYRGTTPGNPLPSFSTQNENIRDFTVPGAKSFELADSERLSDNPYFQAFYSGAESPFDELINSDPGVVLIFLGMEDIFDFASNGASGVFDVDIQNFSENDLLSINEFETVYQNYITNLLNETEADLIVCTLFDPLIAPFFRTISRAFETDIYPASYVGNLSSFYNEMSRNIVTYHLENDLSLFQARPQIDFDTENWPNTTSRFRARVLVDETMPIFELLNGTQIPNYRQMFDGEMIPYKFVEQLSPESEFSGTMPLNDEEVLILDEISNIRSRVFSYNNTIKDIADSNPRIKIFDLERHIELVDQGSVQFDRVKYTTNFDRNTIFSADGYTLNARGNAFLARELIKLINSEYELSLSLINPNQYKGLNYRLD